MDRLIFPAGCPALWVALLLLGVQTVGRGEEQPAGQETPEQQAAHLQASFAEAVGTRDWKKLETTAEGLKAAGLHGTDLEVVVLRGERDAALGGRSQAGQVITWGLSCRAMAGDPKALGALRELAQADPVPAAMPNQELWAKDREAANAAMKEFHAGLKAIGQRDEALLCLALLKDPGVLSRAVECLATKRAAWGGWFGGGRGDALIMAILLASPQDGWGRLSALLTQEEEGDQALIESQVRLLQGIMSLLPMHRARWAGDGKDVVSVDAEVSALLPKDAEEQVLKAYASVLKRYPADTANQMSLNSLVMIAHSLPKQDAESEVLVAIEGLKTRIAEANPNNPNLVRMIDGVLARHKGNVGGPPPMEPPKVQAEF